MRTNAFLATTILIASLWTPAALACSRAGPKPTDIELFDAAKEVFVARVMKTELATASASECESDPDEPGYCDFVRATYTLSTVLKGDPPATGTVNDPVVAIGNCGIGLLAGWYYVFYVVDDERFVFHPDGSFALGAWLGEDEHAIIRALQAPSRKRPRGETH